MASSVEGKVQRSCRAADAGTLLVRHHVQPRRALYALPASEAKLCAVGQHRLTEVRSIDDDELIEQSWDHPSGRGKRSKLWVGATYLLSDKHDHASALAAVKKIRDKNEAKKEARKKAFFDVNQLSDNKGCMTKGVKEVVYDMSSFLQQAIDKYKKLAGPQFQHLRKVATPFHDDKIARPVGTEAEPRGQLAPIASRILMKLLFAARMARYDLLRAVQGLASRVTKWSVECDKALHRLMCYVASTLEYRMRGFMGDDVSTCKLWLFADSDHAGEHDSKSTSGGFLALVGPNTYFPLAAFSKKQTSIALSSTEAEVVCANVSLRALGLPSSALWSVLQNAGGDSSTKPKHTPRKGDVPNKLLSNHPDSLIQGVTYLGTSHLIDGRVVELLTNLSSLPEPVEMNTHPLRDVWVKLKGTWVQVEEAVAWEELKRRDRPVDPKAEACVIVYRRSTMDYRRHADAEAFMHREIEGIRNTGGRSSEELAPKGSDKDMGLVVTVPHSIQPVVLEDNQATIRILESGKSPAFRHADKTQRINLGWISEQFRRKHYDIAYISTLLQAADILTKPFTNAEKWSRALALMAISPLKLDVRKSGAAATTPGSTLLTQRSPPLHKRLIIEVCCGDDSLIGNLAINKYKDCKVVRITESMNLNDPKTRREVLSIAKEAHKDGLRILVWASLPCTGGSQWARLNLAVDKNRSAVFEARRKFTKLWASFVDLSHGLDRLLVDYAIEWPQDCEYWKWTRIVKWIEGKPIRKAHFDGCRFGLRNEKGESVKKPWTIATTLDSLYVAFRDKCCTGGHVHGKCNRSSEEYCLRMVDLIHKAFQENMSRTPCTYVAAPAIKLPSNPRLESPPCLSEGMASRAVEILSAEERAARLQEMSAAATDADRLADALAGLSSPAWWNDAVRNFREPTEADSPDDLFLRVIPVQQWLDLRKGYPSVPWTTIYEMWYRIYGVRAYSTDDVPSKTVHDSSLAGWTQTMLDLIFDMAVVGWGPRAQSAFDVSKPYDLCYRVTEMEHGLSDRPLHTDVVQLLGGFYTPAFERIPPPPTMKSQVLIIGDSSLALCTHKGGRAINKMTFQGPLRDVLSHDPRVTEVNVMMEWGKDLTLLTQIVEDFLRIHHPDGLDIFISWAGNDVHGPYGYQGYTWHLVSPWIKQTEEQIRRAEHWPVKQLAKVETALRKVVALAGHECVRSLTVVAGTVAQAYGLDWEYDREMKKHTDYLVANGVRVVDPYALLYGTVRYDKYHMVATQDNFQAATDWWRALVSTTLTGRQIFMMREDFLANQRSQIFNNHFHLAQPEMSLTVPPCTDMVRPRIEDFAWRAPTSRDQSEEIIVAQNVVRKATNPSDEDHPDMGAVPITEDDRAYLNPDGSGGDDDEVILFDANNPRVRRLMEALDSVEGQLDDEQAVEIEKERGIDTIVINDPDDPDIACEPLLPINEPDSSVEEILHQTRERVRQDKTLIDLSEDVTDLGNKVLPAPSRAAPPKAMPARAPPGRDGPTIDESAAYWCVGSEMPVIQIRRYLSPNALETLSRKMTWLLRGFSKKCAHAPHLEFDGNGTTSFPAFFEALGQIWNGLRMEQIFQVCESSEKERFEFLIHPGGRILRCRAIQGHSGALMTENSDPMLVNRRSFHLVDGWRPSLREYPPVGEAGFTHSTFHTMPKMGYHSTYFRHFRSIVESGIIPGGMSRDGSRRRFYAVMSPKPAWERDCMEGVRPDAEIEFVVDLQMAALDGVRIFETAAGAVQTPDWLSNRYLVYAYRRSSNEPIWINRAYEHARLRIDKAVKEFAAHRNVLPVFDNDPYRCMTDGAATSFLDYLKIPPEENFTEWAPLAADAYTPFQLHYEPNWDYGGQPVRIPEGHPLYPALHNACWGMRALVLPTQTALTVDRKLRGDPRFFRHQQCVAFPNFNCPFCDCNDLIDGLTKCLKCEERLTLPTDLAKMAQPFEARDDATRRGRPMNIFEIQPSIGLNSNRDHRNPRRVDDTTVDRRKSSSGATLKAKINKSLSRQEVISPSARSWRSRPWMPSTGSPRGSASRASTRSRGLPTFGSQTLGWQEASMPKAPTPTTTSMGGSPTFGAATMITSTS